MGKAPYKERLSRDLRGSLLNSPTSRNAALLSRSLALLWTAFSCISASEVGPLRWLLGSQLEALTKIKSSDVTFLEASAIEIPSALPP